MQASHSSLQMRATYALWLSLICRIDKASGFLDAWPQPIRYALRFFWKFSAAACGPCCPALCPVLPSGLLSLRPGPSPRQPRTTLLSTSPRGQARASHVIFSDISDVTPEATRTGQQIHKPPFGCSRLCAFGSMRLSSARDDAKQTITSSWAIAARGVCARWRPPPAATPSTSARRSSERPSDPGERWLFSPSFCWQQRSGVASHFWLEC